VDLNVAAMQYPIDAVGGHQSQISRTPGVALREIREAIRIADLDGPASHHVALELLVHLAFLGFGLVGFFASQSGWVRAGSLAIAMLGHLGVTTNSHTWTHRSGSSRRWVNDALAFFTGNFISGISFTYWHDKHNRRHHAFPNVQGADPDHDFAPFVALTDVDLEGRSRIARLYYRWQWIVIPLMVAVMLPRMKAEGFVHSVRCLGRAETRGIAVADVLCQLASLAAWWGVPIWIGGFENALLINLVREVSLSYALFAIFAPAHIPQPAIHMGDEVRSDFMLRQTATTLNFQVGRLAAFFFSGLQYQLEHHLLMDVPHVHYAKVQPIVEKVCRRHGYPYRVIPWSEGLRETFAVLRSPKAVVALPEIRSAAEGV
jgi:fatty acid desaturase